MRFKRFPRVVAFLAIAAMAINRPVLCRSAEPGSGKDGSDKNIADHTRQVSEEKILAELKIKTDLKFADVTLADAIKTIADRHHLEIQFDEAAPKTLDRSANGACAATKAERNEPAAVGGTAYLLAQCNVKCSCKTRRC